MSKQLAISSAFATFAMAAMVLLYTPDRASGPAGETFMPAQAGMAGYSLPGPSLFTR
jgi:hypothetical protein